MTKAQSSTRIFYVVYFILLFLLFLSWAIAYVNLGPFNTPLTLIISVAKTILIVLFFMEVAHAQGIIRLSVWIGTVWFSIFIGLILADYLTRGWSLIPGK